MIGRCSAEKSRGETGEIKVVKVGECVWCGREDRDGEEKD
ncbi:hypothetical protein TIFTF001_010459 [Ficus carica]|uniref:Uncharacterized protein n=1 Tax=Ficus carica TaxID=3494 RepID=A0AA88A8P7_FICCA|nr:hypothetical protein TIFTF001_010459 [Ficus carica]